MENKCLLAKKAAYPTTPTIKLCSAQKHTKICLQELIRRNGEWSKYTVSNMHDTIVQRREVPNAALIIKKKHARELVVLTTTTSCMWTTHTRGRNYQTHSSREYSYKYIQIMHVNWYP